MALEITLAGRTHHFARTPVRIGTAPDNDLVVALDSTFAVSPHHAVIDTRGLLATIEDLGSPQGTYVDGEQIAGQRVVEPNSRVRLGSTGPELRITAVDESTDEADRTIVAGPFGSAAPIPRTNLPTPSVSVSPQRTPSPAAAAAPSWHVPSPAAPAPRSQPAVPRAAPPAFSPPAAPQVTPQGPTQAPRSSSGGAMRWLPWIALLAVVAGVPLYVESRLKGTQQDVEAAAGTAKDAAKVFLDQFGSMLGPELESDYRAAVAAYDEVATESFNVQRDSSLSDLEKQKRLRELQERAALHSNTVDLINKKLAEARGLDWSTYAKEYGQSIFLIAIIYLDRKNVELGWGTGTGWVAGVDEKRTLLGTNAHVAAMLQKRNYPKGVHRAMTFAIQGGTGKVFEIKDVRLHPQYSGVLSPDVAVIYIDHRGVALKPLPLADEASLRRLEAGSAMATMGFPGELQREYLSGLVDQLNEGRDYTTLQASGAVPVFKACYVNRLTNFEQQSASFDTLQLISHNASISGGTSGSPMIDDKGRVVALNNGGMETTIGENSIPSAAELNIAIRVDLLQELLAKK
jgi:S1-C subfamily serine protease